MERAIDISYWQGSITTTNFNKVKNSGIKKVILRSSYTSTSKFSLSADSRFPGNIINANDVGMDIGVYHYSQATSVPEAQKEADYCLAKIAAYKSYINMPVFFDWEWGGRLSAKKAKALGKKKCTEICNAFCARIAAAGYQTGVYASMIVFRDYLYASEIYNKYYIWVAQYNSTCDYHGPKYMWQYSSSGSVPGISGRVDMNYFYGDQPAPKPEPELGKITVDGIWGKATTQKLQKIYGLTIDGIVSSQPKTCKKYLSGCSTTSWKFVSKANGSSTIKQLQKQLRVTADGKMGQNTVKALQKMLGIGVDGYCGAKTVRAFQEYLNTK